MNDQTPEPNPVPTEENAHIRALLAELGSGPDCDTMPPAVAARLEETLARLVAERDGAPLVPVPGQDVDEPGSVVPLRRRWPSRLTAAAAAVIVLAAGGVAAANLGVFGGAGTSQKSGAAEDSTAAGSAAQAPTASPGSDSSLTRQSADGLPEVHSTSLASDATRLLRRRGALVPPGGRTSAACPGPRTGDGALTTPVRYDGRLAALVVHPEQGGHRLAEVWTCSGDSRLATAALTP